MASSSTWPSALLYAPSFLCKLHHNLSLCLPRGRALVAAWVEAAWVRMGRADGSWFSTPPRLLSRYGWMGFTLYSGYLEDKVRSKTAVSAQRHVGCSRFFLPLCDQTTSAVACRCAHRRIFFVGVGSSSKCKRCGDRERERGWEWRCFEIRKQWPPATSRLSGRG